SCDSATGYPTRSCRRNPSRWQRQRSRPDASPTSDELAVLRIESSLSGEEDPWSPLTAGHTSLFPASCGLRRSSTVPPRPQRRSGGRGGRVRDLRSRERSDGYAGVTLGGMFWLSAKTLSGS